MSGLDRFFSTLDAYKKTLTWAIGSSAILPLIASFAGLAPIWPSGTPLLTSLFTLFCIILVFQFLERTTRKRAGNMMLCSIGLAVFLLIAYLYAFSEFVFQIPEDEKLIYVGCGWSERSIEVSSIYEIDVDNGCPGNYSEILPAFNYEAVIVWADSSVTYVRMMMILLWLALFSSISVFIATFIVFQARRA